MAIQLARSKDDPWKLKTPPGTAEYPMPMNQKEGLAILVCTVGNAVLHGDARCIEHLHAMLREAGAWVELGGADEPRPAEKGTVEPWARSPSNPAGGWYGLNRGSRGRFGACIPSLI